MKTHNAYQLGVGLTALLCCLQGHAGEWRLDPSLELSENYTDNVSTETTEKTDSWVTQLTPRLLVSGEGRDIRGSLLYSLNSLAYSHDSDLNSSSSLYNGRLGLDLFDKRLRLGAIGRKGRHVRSLFASPFRNDLISNPDNSYEVESYALNADFSSHLERWLTYSLGGQVNKVAAGHSLGSSTGDNYYVNINSGTRFTNSYLQINGRVREFERNEVPGDITGIDDQRFTNLDGQLGWGMTDSLFIFVKYFKEDNRFSGSRSFRRDSDHWGPGLRWAPNRQFDVRLSYNYALDDSNTNFVGITTRWSPSRRTNLQLATGKRYYGDYYNVSLQQFGKRWRFNGGYYESTSHFRIRLFDEPLQGHFICPQGTEEDLSTCTLSPTIAPEPGPDEILIPLADVFPEFVEAPQLDKRYFVNTSFGGARVSISANAIASRRTDLINAIESESNRVSLAVNTRLGSRSNLLLEGNYREYTRNISDPSEAQTQDRFYRLQFSREINDEISWRASISHINRLGRGLASDYEENRFSLSITKEF